MSKPLKPHYSGKGSEYFWRRVNALKNREDWIAAYNLGCALQDVESRVLNFMNRGTTERITTTYSARHADQANA